MSIDLKSLSESLFIRGDDAAARTITIGQQVTNSDVIVVDTATFSLSAAGAVVFGSSLTAASAALSGAITVGTTLTVGGVSTLTGAVTAATGISSPMQGTDNEAFGSLAGESLTSGANNTLVGANAGNALSTQSSNVHIGNDAGLLCEANNNVFIGDGAGNTTTTGSGCILIGAIQATGATTSDELRIHNDAAETPVISGTMGVNKVGVNTLSHNAQMNVTADDADALNVLELTQSDDSEAFINFAGTSSAATTTPLSSFTTPGAVAGHLKIEINGVEYWLPFYADPS